MLTTKQVQNQLGVTRQTLYLWRKQGIIAVIKEKMVEFFGMKMKY
ncbi:helix-turn-helix domain-containing protein [Lactobacillus johnsonii]|nr:helix-turn-helix domain-containing protein [Lactobacillus johnsonii]